MNNFIHQVMIMRLETDERSEESPRSVSEGMSRSATKGAVGSEDQESRMIKKIKTTDGHVQRNTGAKRRSFRMMECRRNDYTLQL